MLIISNRPRASRLSDFEIICAITPWIVLHSVQYLLQIFELAPGALISNLRENGGDAIKFSQTVAWHDSFLYIIYV